jgi:hypothetical protein
VEALIALGSISSLAPETEIPEGVEHNFETPAEGITVAYNRDRGETLDIKHHDSVGDFINSDIEEYGYVFTAAGEWLFADGHSSSSTRKAKSLKNELINKNELVG